MIKSYRVQVAAALVGLLLVWRFGFYVPQLDQTGPQGVCGSIFAGDGPQGIEMAYDRNGSRGSREHSVNARIYIYRIGDFRPIGYIEGDSRFKVALSPGNYTFSISATRSERAYEGVVHVEAGQWTTFDIHINHDGSHDQMVC